MVCCLLFDGCCLLYCVLCFELFAVRVCVVLSMVCVACVRCLLCVVCCLSFVA